MYNELFEAVSGMFALVMYLSISAMISIAVIVLLVLAVAGFSYAQNRAKTYMDEFKK